MIYLYGIKQKLSASHLWEFRFPWVYHKTDRVFTLLTVQSAGRAYRLFSGYFCKYPFFYVDDGGATIKENRINEEIRVSELRLIGTDGSMLGIVSPEEALAKAEEAKLDLVEISPGAKPPVCKIMDYGKYRYDTQKRQKEARKKQKNMQVKEIRLSTFIEEHDIRVKAKTASKFLLAGDKVKVSLRFRGRELGHTQLGREVMEKFADICADVAVVEKKPVMEGRSMVMFLAPKTGE